MCVQCGKPKNGKERRDSLAVSERRNSKTANNRQQANQSSFIVI